MVALYREGKTMREVAWQAGLSKQRVHQLLKQAGLCADDGGRAIKSKKRRGDGQQAQDQRYMARWGHSWPEHKQLLQMPGSPVRAYCCQNKNAAQSGISWNITLAEWWAVWQASGKWEKRGRGAGFYVMGRIRRNKGFAKGNLKIERFEETGHRKRRGSLPAGVTETTSGRFQAKLMQDGQLRHLGTFDTQEEARLAYLTSR